MNLRDLYNSKIGILRAILTFDEIMNMKIRPSKDGEWLGQCPVHCSEELCFHVYPEKNLYVCKTCGIHGDVFDFVNYVDEHRKRTSMAG
jgi:DNA primase